MKHLSIISSITATDTIIILMIFLRARPVVNLETELRFVTPVQGKIDLGSADCVTAKGDQVRVVVVVMVVTVVVAVVLSCSWLIFSSPAARPGDLLPALPLLEILGHRSCR